MRTRAEIDHYSFYLFSSTNDQVPNAEWDNPVSLSDDRTVAVLISGLQYGQVELMVTTQNEPLDHTTPPDFDITETMNIGTELIAQQGMMDWAETVFSPPNPGEYHLRFRIWGRNANRAHPLEPVDEFWRIDITPHGDDRTPGG